jgi:ribosomal protein S18 acetylase RimI-like enzyme
MAGFNLRPATLEDAATLADLGRRTFLETFGTLYDPADLTAFFDETYGEALQRAELEDPARPALVLEQEGLPVGFAQLRIGHPDASVRGFRPAEIQRIYLLKAAQGGGGGAALMQACEDLAAAREADVLWLGVWEGNTKALAFYARMGFREVGEHPFAIGKRTDRDLILMKDLS